MTDRKQLEKEPRRQAEDLAEAECRKDEFLAMLSHELRNPLAPILNAVHLIRHVRDGDAVLRQAGDMIERQVHHLARLIDDLLEVTRLTRGKVMLRRERLDLGAAVRRAAEGVRPLMRERSHEFTVSLPPHPVWVEGDAGRLGQILVNLLDNAARYTDAGGRVSLSLTEGGGQAVLRVRDTGIGITADLLPRIFDLFAQADAPPDRARGGLGVGLTLVRNLVEMHGGVIQAASAGPDRGSEFTVRLPAVAEGPRATPQAPAPCARGERFDNSGA